MMRLMRQFAFVWCLWVTALSGWCLATHVGGWAAWLQFGFSNPLAIANYLYWRLR